jgi:hypothetical protein
MTTGSAGFPSMTRPAGLAIGSQCAIVLAAAALGCIAWGEHPEALGLAPALAGLWALSSSRIGAGLTAFAYYLGVARGLPSGTAVFFGVDASPLIGIALWLAVSAFLALPWGLFWPKGGRGYWWRLLAVLAAVSVPPLGAFGWGNPITGAGILFPATGWAGLAATWLLMVAYSRAASSRRPLRNTLYVTAVLACLVLAAAMAAGHQPPRSAAVKGIDTQLSGVGLGSYDFLTAYRNNQALIASAAQHAGTKAVLLPESVAGLWQSATADLWQRADGMPSTVFLGAAEPHRGGDYSNAIVAITPQGSQVVYRQRMPVPIGMWHPWREDSAVAHWDGPGVFELDAARYGALICFEQLLIWPVLQTYAASPSLVLAPTNAWWSKGTAVPAIQESVVTAWARLFAVPVVTAYNY